MNILTQEILKKINDHIGFDLHVIEDIQSYFNDSTRYPDSYRKVMTIEEEMVGSMYSKCAFTDQEGNLVGLNFFNCGLTTDQLDKALKDIPLGDLKSLNLGKNKLSRFHLSDQFKSMVYLALNENEELQSLGLHAACGHVARLELFECNIRKLSFPSTYHKLFYVDLSGNKNLTDCTFQGGLNFLQVLFLRDTAMEQFSLPGHFPELVHAYLNVNESLKEVEIENPLPKLSTLQLRNCGLNNFSEEHIKLGEEEIKNEDFWRQFEAYFPKIEAVFFGENPVKDSTLLTKLVDEKANNNLETLRKYYAQREGG